MYNQLNEKKNEIDQVYRIIFVGDSSVGKTNIITKYKYNTFEDSHLTTIGIDFVSKILNIRNKTIRLNIWDTAGQEKYRIIANSYYRNSNAVCIVYDITNKISYYNIKRWIEDVKKNCSPSVDIYIIGSKLDVQHDREINKNDVEKYCEENNFKYFEVSALNNYNIHNLFHDIAFTLMKKYEIEPKKIVKVKRKNYFDCCKIS